MLNDTDEEYHQLSFEDIFEQDVKPNLFAVSRVFAEARKQMNLAEYKAFTYALSQISWKEECPSVMHLDKKEVARVVGIEADTDHLSTDLKRAIGDMPKHSYLSFSDEDSKTWVNGSFVSTVAMFKNVVRIRMNPDFLSLFGNLDKNYITMWSGDIYQMHSERAIKFYELLRENSDTRLSLNVGTVGIRKFKELFDIPKDGEGSYMNQKTGHFDRYNFEKFVIDPICRDLTKTRMLQLVIQSDGKYYEKVKRGNRIIAYKFCWTITMHPRVAASSEVKEIQDKVDKNPKVLKVAKNIVEGKAKPKKKKKNSFDFEEKNEYDDTAIAKAMFLKNQF